MMKWVGRIVAALVGLLVLAIVVLLALGRRPDAGVNRATIEIARPPAVVWSWLSEPEKLKQWVDWLVAVESDTTSPSGVGHREVWVMDDPNMKQQMRLPATVTAVDPPRSMSAHIAEPGSFDGDVSYTLEDLGNDRTRVTQLSRFKYTNPLYVLLEPLVTPEAQKKADSDFAKLKARAEAAAH